MAGILFFLSSIFYQTELAKDVNKNVVITVVLFRHVLLMNKVTSD